MAGRKGIALQSGITTGTSAKTLIQLVAAANHAIRLVEVAIGFHGTSNTAEPIKVELVRQTDAGTMSSLTLVNADSGVNDTLDTTGQHTATAEPTGSTVVRVWAIHPQTQFVISANELTDVIVPASGRIGLRVTAAASTTADAYLAFIE